MVSPAFRGLEHAQRVALVLSALEQQLRHEAKADRAELPWTDPQWPEEHATTDAAGGGSGGRGGVNRWTNTPGSSTPGGSAGITGDQTPGQTGDQTPVGASTPTLSLPTTPDGRAQSKGLGLKGGWGKVSAAVADAAAAYEEPDTLVTDGTSGNGTGSAGADGGGSNGGSRPVTVPPLSRGLTPQHRWTAGALTLNSDSDDAWPVRWPQMVPPPLLPPSAGRRLKGFSVVGPRVRSLSIWMGGAALSLAAEGWPDIVEPKDGDAAAGGGGGDGGGGEGRGLWFWGGRGGGQARRRPVGRTFPELLLDLRTPNEWRPQDHGLDAFERQDALLR